MWGVGSYKGEHQWDGHTYHLGGNCAKTCYGL